MIFTDLGDERVIVGALLKDMVISNAAEKVLVG